MRRIGYRDHEVPEEGTMEGRTIRERVFLSVGAGGLGLTHSESTRDPAWVAAWQLCSKPVDRLVGFTTAGRGLSIADVPELVGAIGRVQPEVGLPPAELEPLAEGALVPVAATAFVMPTDERFFGLKPRKGLQSELIALGTAAAEHSCTASA